MDFLQALLQELCSKLKARHIFGGLGHVVSFVKNDDGVGILNLEVLLDFLVDEVVVWHEDQVSCRSTVFVSEVWTVLFTLCDLVKLFNVHCFPGHLRFAFIAVFEKDARI
jgi:NDP-sugar pyrophosphorylase family protein